MSEEHKSGFINKNRSPRSSSSEEGGPLIHEIEEGSVSYSLLQDTLKKYCPIEKVYMDGTMITEEVREEYR